MIFPNIYKFKYNTTVEIELTYYTKGRIIKSIEEDVKTILRIESKLPTSISNRQYEYRKFLIRNLLLTIRLKRKHL